MARKGRHNSMECGWRRVTQRKEEETRCTCNDYNVPLIVSHLFFITALSILKTFSVHIIAAYVGRVLIQDQAWSHLMHGLSEP